MRLAIRGYFPGLETFKKMTCAQPSKTFSIQGSYKALIRHQYPHLVEAVLGSSLAMWRARRKKGGRQGRRASAGLRRPVRASAGRHEAS